MPPCLVRRFLGVDGLLWRQRLNKQLRLPTLSQVRLCFFLSLNTRTWIQKQGDKILVSRQHESGEILTRGDMVRFFRSFRIEGGRSQALPDGFASGESGIA